MSVSVHIVIFDIVFLRWKGLQKQINSEILKEIQKASTGKVKLGLDLSGGTQFVVQVMPELGDDGQLLPIDSSQLTQAMEVMRSRVDKYGLAEPLIQTRHDH